MHALICMLAVGLMLDKLTGGWFREPVPAGEPLVALHKGVWLALYAGDGLACSLPDLPLFVSGIVRRGIPSPKVNQGN